jgi:hypothetical protein
MSTFAKLNFKKMKRPIILFVIVFLLTVEGISQVKPFRFGVKVGPNIGWLSPDSKNYENDGGALGFAWGFVADITLADNYFVKTGFNINYLNGNLQYPHQKKLSDNDPVATPGELSRKYNLRYLEFPVIMKLRTNQFGKIAYFGEIGLTASINLKATAKDDFAYDINGVPSLLQSEEDIDEEVRNLAGSLLVGGGLEYFIDASTSLFVSINFNNGLNNVLKGNNSIDQTVEQKAKLNFLQLNIGVMF